MGSNENYNEALYTFCHWAGIPTFLRCPYKPDMTDTDIGIIGFPYSGGNAIERMQYLGPRAVRNRSSAYRRTPRNIKTNIFEMARVSDLGDVPIESWLNPDLATKEAEAFYKRVHALGISPITIGGDHSVTTPILRAIGGKNSKNKKPLGMIHFDSHTDAQSAMGGTKHHAGAAFRLGVEEKLIDPRRTVQVGLKGPLASPLQESWSKENLNTITMDEIIDRGIDWTASEIHRIIGSEPAYLSFDLDVIDLAYAPAVADPEVNGLTTRELFSLMNKLRGIDFIGADIVCFCPPLDNPAQTTALTASELLLQFAGLIAEARQKHGKGKKNSLAYKKIGLS